MGFKKVYVPKDSIGKSSNLKKIDIIELKTLMDVINNIYRS